MLLQSGWTDDLFPPKESIRAYNDSRNRGGFAAMQFGDLGHFRGSNKENADRHFNDEGSAFFDQHLRGAAGGPASGQVTAFTQTCPKSAPADGPFVASSYRSLARGAVAFGSSATQTVLSAGGNPATGTAFDPIVAGAGEGACTETGAETAPGTAVVLGPPSRGYTLLGLPTVTARIATTGLFGQLDSRLWDVSPDRHAAADQPRRVQAARQPERADRVPAPRQRLVLRARPPPQARAARQGRAVPAPEQRHIHGPGV